jgi:tRNA dimethylallyltransferase
VSDGADGRALRAPLLVVVGPTASGKTELALSLAALGDGEIVSADSVQIYRHFDIGSGKPTREQLEAVPHHLIGEFDPLEEIDAARFAELAEARILEIVARGKRPIVCGGTYLWTRALLFGLAPMPAADPGLRATHRAFAHEHGHVALHERLREIDEPAFLRLNPNDFVRVSRALEVHELTGTSLSELQAAHGFRQARFRHRLLGVRRGRDESNARITRRVEAMVRAGWQSEVKELLERGYAGARAMGAVGYRQVRDALQGGGSLDETALVAAIAQATRVFARRQRTWLRDLPVEWLAPDDDGRQVLA